MELLFLAFLGWFIYALIPDPKPKPAQVTNVNGERVLMIPGSDPNPAWFVEWQRRQAENAQP